MREIVTALITTLLGAGGATFVGALIKGWKSLRAGARAHERQTVQDLAAWNEELEARARAAERDRDFWRIIAARYAGQLTRAGHDPVPTDPVPPSERS